MDQYPVIDFTTNNESLISFDERNSEKNNNQQEFLHSNVTLDTEISKTTNDDEASVTNFKFSIDAMTPTLSVINSNNNNDIEVIGDSVVTSSLAHIDDKKIGGEQEPNFFYAVDKFSEAELLARKISDIMLENSRKLEESGSESEVALMPTSGVFVDVNEFVRRVEEAVVPQQSVLESDVRSESLQANLNELLREQHSQEILAEEIMEKESDNASVASDAEIAQDENNGQNYEFFLNETKSCEIIEASNSNNSLDSNCIKAEEEGTNDLDEAKSRELIESYDDFPVPNSRSRSNSGILKKSNSAEKAESSLSVVKDAEISPGFVAATADVLHKASQNRIKCSRKCSMQFCDIKSKIKQFENIKVVIDSKHAQAATKPIAENSLKSNPAAIAENAEEFYPSVKVKDLKNIFEQTTSNN